VCCSVDSVLQYEVAHRGGVTVRSESLRCILVCCSVDSVLQCKVADTDAS